MNALVVGQEVRMVQGGAVLRIESREAEGSQGIVYRATMADKTPVAVKWIKDNPEIERQRRSIAELTRRPRPHPAYSWPIDIVAADGVAGFGYVMPWVSPKRFVTLTEVLEKPPPLRTIAAIGRDLADAFSKLHALGLCYRDINFGNLRVDPVGVEVAIVDNDNVGVLGGDVFVLGTMRFMAPEVIRGEAEPSIESDLHSLAVFLFYLLVHSHPLEGAKVHGSYTWRTDGHVSETDVVVRGFGREPLFIFDPADHSNAPIPGDPATLWWPIYPRFVHELFERAFGPGLKDSAAGSRVVESEWRKAMLRLGDSVDACRCGAAVLYDADDPTRACWHCANRGTPPLVLDVRQRRIVLAEGAVLTRDLVFSDRRYRDVLGAVEAHPRDPGKVVLHNLTEESWSAHPLGEEVLEIPPDRRFAVRPGALTIGAVDTVIRVAPG
jgi:DNA-binding helix-hairpin-helix protein with protein kinase domain